MTSNFESPQNSMNSVERDRFELLSAYLDGEATAAERKQVQAWLDNDAQVQQLYRRLLKLRHGLKTLPVPAPEKSAAELSQGVFRRLRKRQLKQALVMGGGAIAAVLIGAIAGLQGPSLKMAETGETPANPPVAATPVSDNTLMIAVNRPVVEIPKAPVAVELGSPNP